MTAESKQGINLEQARFELEQMLDLLQRESIALQAGDIETLEKITALKSSCIRTLTSWGDALPAQSGPLVELATACAKLNAENGTLVNAALRGTQKALEFLTDIPASDQGSAYNLSGRSVLPDPPRPGNARLFSYSA